MATVKKLLIIEKELSDKVQAIADAERRSWNAQALYLIEKAIESYQDQQTEK